VRYCFAQFLFFRSAELLDLKFAPQRETPTSLPFRIHQYNGQARACVFRTVTGIVADDARIQIVAYAAIQRAVGAAQQINVPAAFCDYDLHLSARANE
jgi:hypothetical protein